MIHRQGHLIPDDFPDLAHIVFQEVQSLFRQVDPREGVGCVDDRVALLVPDHIRRHRAALDVQDMGRVALHILDEPEGSVDGPRLIHQQADAQIHFKEGEAHLHPLFERQAHVVPGMLPVHVRIAVYADAVPETAAQELIHRDAVRLPRQVPQGDLDAGYAAALPRMPAELLDLAENAVHIAGVFPQDAALEHQGVCFARRVSHLAIAHQALIGIQLHQRTPLGRAVDIHKTHIGDLQAPGIHCPAHRSSR